MFKGSNCIVFGGLGFIGHHLVNRLIDEGAKVKILDAVTSGLIQNLNFRAEFINCDVTQFESVKQNTRGVDYVFNLCAIARTPWCIDDPILCYQVNVMGCLNVLEACRQNNIKRVVQSSSNVVYAFDTPYRTSKEAVERLGDCYVNMYKQSVISLRYSNVYGKGQSELGPSPNVFAALRKSKRENGKLLITGDGEQSRDYTHVSDIVEGNIKAALSGYCGVIDLCTGVNTSLNTVSKFFECPVEYIDERPGDVKHIVQNPLPAKEILGWEYKVKLEDGIKDVLDV